MRKFSTLIPSDNPLRLWLYAHSNLETPRSFLALTAMAAVGASLKRSLWFDHEHFKIYPNTNVLLVGPSGIGKDVAIDLAEEILQSLDTVKNVGARTIESIYERLKRQGDPACGYILMPEITAYIGRKDYQKGFIQDLTDILTTKDYKDYNTKKEQFRILRPTVSILAGSTVEWLQKEMPEGTTEGGFFPRFVIVTESKPMLYSPLPKHDSRIFERRERLRAKSQFMDAMKRVVEKSLAHPGEAMMEDDSMDWYRNWYHNRFRFFSPVIRDYANRSRDQILRLAMISAKLRGTNWISMSDCLFASGIISYIAESLEDTIIPASPEKRARKLYLDLLQAGPKPYRDVVKTMLKAFDVRIVDAAEKSLIKTGQIVFEKAGKTYNVSLHSGDTAK